MTDAAERVLLNPDTLDELREDSGVVVNLGTLEYIELDRVGTAMWRALRVAGTVPGAVTLLQERFDAPAEVLEADLRRLIGQLEAAGLIGDPAAPVADAGAEVDPRHLYLDLLERGVTGLLSDPVHNQYSGGHHLGSLAQGRTLGGASSLSMIGLARMRNVRSLCERTLLDGVPGDFVETGVWRGGAVVMMRGVLAAYADTHRTVWAVDSFQGLPPTDPETYPLDSFWTPLEGRIAVSQEEVQRAFAAYGLLDEQVRFLPGWFADTLPTAPIESIAVLRMDGDLYQSTIETLTHLYGKVSPGGFVIVDDYTLESCRQAVHDFRDAHGITAEIVPIDWASAYWQVPR